MSFKTFLKSVNVKAGSWSNLLFQEQGYHIHDFIEGGGEIIDVISFLNEMEVKNG